MSYEVVDEGHVAYGAGRVNERDQRTPEGDTSQLCSVPNAQEEHRNWEERGDRHTTYEVDRDARGFVVPRVKSKQ